jgi:putative PEP-CTERM system TPR-repeat lipoprotein
MTSLRMVLAATLASALLAAACSDSSPQSHLASAKQYLYKRQLPAAMIELRSALQRDPHMAEARFLFGKLLLESGEAGAATIELRKARDLKHPDVEVVPLLARSLLLQRQYKALSEQFGDMTWPDARATADLKTTLATAYATSGLPEKAQAELDSALQLAPDHVPARVLQVRILAAKGDVAGASGVLAQILQARPTDASAWKAQGDLLRIGQRDDQAALAAYRKVVEFEPGNVDAHADIVAILLAGDDREAARKQIAQLKALAPQHPQTRYLEARLALLDKDYKTARSLLEQVLLLEPDHGSARELAGVTELRAGTPAQARAHLARALQQAPHRIGTRRLLAEAHLRAGKAEDALKALQPVLGSYADARSLALAGQAYLQLGDAKRAQASFARAAELDPKDMTSRTRLAIARMDQGQVDAGVQELERLAAGDAGGTSADMALISAHLARKEFEAARKAIDRLEGKVENKGAVAGLRGRALLLMGDRKGAREAFERALEIDPNDYSATASLAMLDAGAGKPELARKRYEAVLQRDGRHVEALLALADLRARSPNSGDEVLKLIDRAVKADPADVNARLRLVEHHLAARQPKLALTAAQEAAALSRDSARVLDVLGRAQMAAGEHNQAVATYGRLATLQPESAAALVRLAGAELARNDIAAARERLKRALALSPNEHMALRGLATVELRGNRAQEALAVTRQLQKRYPRDALAVALEGDAELMLRRYDAAIAAYRRSLKVGPSTDAAVKLEELLRRAGKAPEAEQFAAGWLKEHPRDARFIYHLADVALLRGNFAAAEARYREVLAVTPDNFLAMNNVAWTMVRQNKRGAVDIAERANRLRVNDPSLMDTLAIALAQDKQFERAIQVQREALQLKPQNQLVRMNLARIYLAAGRKDDARTELNGLAALGDKFEGQAEVARMLESLKGG